MSSPILGDRFHMRFTGNGAMHGFGTTLSWAFSEMAPRRLQRLGYPVLARSATTDGRAGDEQDDAGQGSSAEIHPFEGATEKLNWANLAWLLLGVSAVLILCRAINLAVSP